MFGHSFRQLCTVATRSVRRPNAFPVEMGFFKTTLQSISAQSVASPFAWKNGLKEPEIVMEKQSGIIMELDSVMRKRKKKMKKHKLRKRRKREKAEKRKLSQGR